MRIVSDIQGHKQHLHNNKDIGKAAGHRDMCHVVGEAAVEAAALTLGLTATTIGVL